MSLLLQIGIANLAVASVLAVLAFVVGKISRRPALVHSLWLLVLLKLVTPPLFWLPITVEKAEYRSTKSETNPKSEEENPSQFSGIGNSNLGFVSDFVLRISDFTAASLPLVFWTWGGGAVLWFLWAGVHLFRFQRLLRFARPAPAGLQAEADRLAAQMGLSRSPVVWLLPGALPPLVWTGTGKARLFFPAGLLDRLNAEERATLLAHELAHVCRRDHWVRVLELVVRGLYWWCPLVWWATRQLQAHEEECCDAWVVGELPARSYASAILHTLDFLAAGRQPVLLGASRLSGRVQQIKKRLIQIMQQRTPKRLSLAGQLSMLVLGLLLLPLLPTVVFSQPPVVFSQPEPVATVAFEEPVNETVLEEVPIRIVSRPTFVYILGEPQPVPAPIGVVRTARFLPPGELQGRIQRGQPEIVPLPGRDGVPPRAVYLAVSPRPTPTLPDAPRNDRPTLDEQSPLGRRSR